MKTIGAIAGLLPPHVAGGVAQLQMIRHVYTANAVWTRPASGLRFIIVKLQGGGGAGGGMNSTAANQSSAGAGGGGGGYGEKLIMASALVNATEAVTVGQGGNGGTGNGPSGTASSFGAHCSATAGAGGDSLLDETSRSQISGGVGGLTTNCDISIPGGRGGAGHADFFNTGGGSSIGGVGGVSFLGTGAGTNFVYSTTSANGANGQGYGSGGQGARGGGSQPSATGGDGADGLVIVEEYY